MAVNFDAPVKKPGGSNAVAGPQSAEVSKVEIKTSKNTGKEYLAVQMKLSKGGMLFESFFDSDKEFPIYKLRRFLDAIGVELSGTLTLKDIAKFVQQKIGTKLDVVIVIADNDYAASDFKGSNEGFYKAGFFEELDDEECPFDSDDADASDEDMPEEATTDIDEDF